MYLSKIIKSIPTNHKVSSGRTIAIQPVQSVVTYQEYDEEASEQQLVERKLEEMEKRAQHMLEEAELQTQQMSDHFEQKEKQLSIQAEQLFEEKRSEGYEQGFKEGEQAAWAEYTDKLLEAQTIVQDAAKKNQELLNQAEPQMIQLACMLAEKILGQAIQQDDSKLAYLKHLLYEAREHEDIKLFVPPSWFAFVQEREQELASLLASTQLLIMPDHKLNALSCVIESKQGRLEASLDKQLESIKEQLLLKQWELVHD